MTRIEIIQQLIDSYNFRNYLEIGVRNGKCFFEIKAKNKIAVDPEFVISSTKKFKRIFSNFSNLNNHWYEETSDDFFARHSDLFTKNKIDIALVDGMHEYHYALRDVENCLNHLALKHGRTVGTKATGTATSGKQYSTCAVSGPISTHLC